MKTVRRRYSA